VHLLDAQPKAGSGESEERRVEAVRTCLELYRLRSRQLDKGKGEILTDIEREAGQANVEVRLRNFVASISSAVFLADDPGKALSLILYGHPRRGAKKKNVYRDFMIAADVEERKRKDETLDAAYDAVRDALGKEMAARGPDAVRRIHARIMKDEGARLEVEAELAMRKISANRCAAAPNRYGVEIAPVSNVVVCGKISPYRNTRPTWLVPSFVPSEVPMDSPVPLLRTKEAAARVGLPEATLEKLRTLGRGPPTSK
jgi:hypothetical protein